MQKHASFLEISAPDHYRFGLALGFRLREEVHGDVKRLKKKKNYTQLRKRARAYVAPTERFAPRLLEELKGYAEGAKVSFEDLWLLSLEDEMDPTDHCTTAVTNDGRLLVHNEDWDIPGSADRLHVLRRTIGKRTALEVYYRNTLGGNAVGMNANGLVQAVDALWCRDRRVGVPKNVVARAVLDAKNAKEAVKIITSAQRASGYAHILLDRHGTTVVEATATGISVSRPSLPYCHTNHILDPKLLRLQTPGRYPSSIARLSVSQEVLKPNMSVRDAERAMADKRHGPKKSLLNQDTIARVILDRDREIFRVWLKKESKKGWVEYPFPSSR